MIPRPIPEKDRDRHHLPPEIDMNEREFEEYATCAGWTPKTIEMLLREFPPPGRFLCGGRNVRIVK